MADAEGYFRLEKVKVGRHTLQCSFVGYQPATIPNVVVTSGKEVILNIQLEASATMMNEVVIEGNRRGEVTNEMATVSAAPFPWMKPNDTPVAATIRPDGF